MFEKRPRDEKCPQCGRPQEQRGWCLMCGPSLHIGELCMDDVTLILYLETCLVDQRGMAQGIRMNDIDMDTVKTWREEGLIDFGRIPFHDVHKVNPGKSLNAGPFGVVHTHWVRFTPRAWDIAHRFRRERAERHVDTLVQEVRA